MIIGDDPTPAIVGHGFSRLCRIFPETTMSKNKTPSMLRRRVRIGDRITIKGPDGRSIETVLGPDVDLDREIVRLPSGRRLTQRVVDELVAKVHRHAGSADEIIRA